MPSRIIVSLLAIIFLQLCVPFLAQAGKISTQVLPNGMSVVLLPDTNQYLELHWAFKGGQESERAEDNGIAYYLNYWPSTQHPDLKADLRQSSFYYHQAVAKKALNAALLTTTKVFAHPFADSIQSEVQVSAQTEMNQLMINPILHLMDDNARALWGTQAHKRDVLANLPIIDMKRIHYYQERYFTPENALLIVRGDISMRSIELALQPCFAHWRSDGTRFQKLYKRSNYQPLNYSAQTVRIKPGIAGPVMIMTWQSPGLRFNPKQSQALDAIAAHINDANSALHQASLAHGASMQVFQETREHYGTFAMVFFPQQDRVEEWLQWFTAWRQKGSSWMLDQDEALFNEVQALDKVQFMLYWWSCGRFTTPDQQESEEWSLSQLKEYALESKPHVASLMSAEPMRAELFLPTGWAYSKRKVNYKKNAIEKAEPSDRESWESIKQFMVINPEARLRIQSHAHQKEYLKRNDQHLISYLDERPELRAQFADFLYGKKHVRLDIARALDLLIELEAAGIAAHRISITGDVKRGEEPGQTIQFVVD